MFIILRSILKEKSIVVGIYALDSVPILTNKNQIIR